jgi:3-oxoacyl-[acyl-carrier protein] reductase
VRNVVVTGGSRGIGLAIAQTLVQSGFRVIAVARRDGPELVAAMQAQPDSLSFESWDLSEIGTLKDLATKLRETYGPVYGLVNNAAAGTAGILSTMPDAAIETMIRLNVTAPITLTKYLVRPMMAARAGRVVNVSSIVATTGYSGLAAYSASKSALLGFCRSLAREVGQLGITVNNVSPGFIETEMTHGMTPEQRGHIMRRSALRRMAETQDVAAAVDFLVSDKAANITGTVMTVDAGSTA